MKKTMGLMAAAIVLAGYSFADSRVVQVVAAGANTYSDPIDVSGYIERVEIKRAGAPLSDVVSVRLATFDGTAVVETFVYEASVATNAATKVYRPRVVGTDTTGTALAASYAVGAGTNGVVQALQVPYERMMAGGNTKLLVGASAGTNATVTATIYFEPIKK